MSDLERRLREEGIRSFDVPIHIQSKKWLIRHFGPGKKYPVNVSLLIKNITWQIRTQIRKELIPPLNGLIRNFWYSHIKPTLSRADSLATKTDQYDQLTKTLTRMVVYRDLMRYKDMGFLNDNAANCTIGPEGYVILFSEKHGHFPLIGNMGNELEVTLISLGGQPSTLSAEYFVDDIKAHGFDVRKSFYIFCLVDYDPSGWIIKDAFLNNLAFYGIRHVKVFDIVTPDILTSEEIELNKYRFPDPPEMRKKNRKWMARTGGINHQFYGLEADCVPPERLYDYFMALASPLVGPSEPRRRSEAMFNLADSLDKLALAILQTP